MERQQGSSEQPGMVGLGKDGLRISPTDPLDAVAEDGRRPWKLVWNPETGEVVHCRPSEDHQFALIRTGKPANWPQEFERWLRVTRRRDERAAGRRPPAAGPSLLLAGTGRAGPAGRGRAAGLKRSWTEAPACGANCLRSCGTTAG
jgi:hypothetical protein